MGAVAAAGLRRGCNDMNHARVGPPHEEMTMNRSRTALLAFALSLAACSSVPYGALPIDERQDPIPNVEIRDTRLYDIVRVGKPIVDRVPGSNQLRVSVQLCNIDQERIQVLAQVTFLDANKQPIGDETNKQVLILASGDVVTHEAISDKTEAVDWVMRIRWNN